MEEMRLRIEKGEELRALLKEPSQAMIEAVRTAIASLQPEVLAAKALRSRGALGARRYATTQQLTVRMEDGTWCDAKVEASETRNVHRLRLESGGTVTLALHPWNHAPRELSTSAFEELREWHLAKLRAEHSHIADALSGQRLDTLQQCVAIDVCGDDDELASVKDAHTLSAWLHSLHRARLAGCDVDRPAAVLLTAGPAAGKTTLLSQVVALSLKDELVPILVKVQQLQHKLNEKPEEFAKAWNFFDAFLRLEHGASSPYYRFLRQAMMARRALLLLDGLDEGGQSRVEIETHVTEVLAPQGHVLLATSRPACVVEARVADLHRLRLSPLTEAQQKQALEQRLGAADAAELLLYVNDKVPRDPETNERVTANPL